MERKLVFGGPPPRGVADEGAASTDDMQASASLSLAPSPLLASARLCLCVG